MDTSPPYFVLQWTEITQGRMEPFAIVPNFDVFKYMSSCLQSAFKHSVCTFRLQGREEAFHTGIVITVALSTHTDPAVFPPQQVQIGFAGVLTAQIAVM